MQLSATRIYVKGSLVRWYITESTSRSFLKVFLFNSLILDILNKYKYVLVLKQKNVIGGLD